MATRNKSNSQDGPVSVSVPDAEQQFKEALEAFFTNYHLKEVEAHLWDWLVAAITREHCIYSDAKERANLIFFYENIKELIDDLWKTYNPPK